VRRGGRGGGGGGGAAARVIHVSAGVMMLYAFAAGIGARRHTRRGGCAQQRVQRGKVVPVVVNSVVVSYNSGQKGAHQEHQKGKTSCRRERGGQVSAKLKVPVIVLFATTVLTDTFFTHKSWPNPSNALGVVS